jgi:hypothetical protein
MTPEELIHALQAAFEYTGDNNRDLLQDELFPMHEVAEELEVERSYQFLIAYISRNKGMIESNLKDS